jgi:hypothetical protein
MPTAPDPIAYLRSPAAIRDRCGQLFDLACADRLRYFRPDLSQLDRVADYVIQVTQASYPDLDIPFHSRWRHFEVGGISRLAVWEQKLAGLSPLEKAWAKYDLAMVSVLLDAGAGPDWQYCEPETGQVLARSEGLAVASFHLFCEGGVSSNSQSPLQADAIGLRDLTEAALSQSFQVSTTNPLVGVAGRMNLLQRLGQTLQQYPQFFGAQNPRPGYLVNYLLEQAIDHQLPAPLVLRAVLEGLGDIWPGRLTIGSTNLGDVWTHSALAGSPYADCVPFHKLSQWLTYSLLEPLQELGVEITELESMTGLPEYRNGGLCLDLGLLQVKDLAILQQSHLPSSEVIVEWRALTVILLDRLAEAVRDRLHQSADQLPLVKILQGGTWAAGRQIAAELRDGSPPLHIASDGTVF